MNIACPSLQKFQRVEADGRLEVRQVGGRTRIARLFQEGAAKLRFPSAESDALEAVLINTAGGLTGGDRVSWRVKACADCHVSLTTQACEKVYRSLEGEAAVTVELTADTRSRIAWLPQETILFDRSALRRRLDVSLAADASALIVEATLFGRQAMGEHVHRANFRDRWRIRVDGRLVHAEDFHIGPDVAGQLASAGIAGGATAIATLLCVGGDCEALLSDARSLVGRDGGASFWRVGPTGKLLARLVAQDGYALRKRLVPLIGLLNPTAGLPKIWTN